MNKNRDNELARYLASVLRSEERDLGGSLGGVLVDPEEQDEIGWGTDAPLPDNPARGGNYQLITNLEWRFPLPLLSRL